jgi:hypothetical protein
MKNTYAKRSAAAVVGVGLAVAAGVAVMVSVAVAAMSGDVVADGEDAVVPHAAKTMTSKSATRGRSM